MAHILADGSDLQLVETSGQPAVAVSTNVNSIFSYSNALLASIMHNEYLRQTQSNLKITSVTSAPYIPAMTVRSVLVSVLGAKDEGSATESAHSLLLSVKKNLGVFKDKFIAPGEFTDPFSDLKLQENFLAWAEEAVSPYWWFEIESETVDILKEAIGSADPPTGTCVSDAPPAEETPEYNALYHSSVATLVSVGSWSLLRQLMPSRYGEN